MSERKYYIVKLICDYNDTSNFEIKKNQECWLGYTTEGGGWFQIFRTKEWAKKFDKKPAHDFIMSQSGRPWYYRIKSYKIIEVTENFTKSERKL